MFSDNSGWRRCASCLPAALMFVVLCGCNNSDNDTRGVRVAARGTVLLDEQPLPAARILFESDHGSGTVRASALVEAGAFAFDPQHGPLVGRARVEVHSVEMELAELEAARGSDPRVLVNPIKVWIPDRYNKDSRLTAEVTDNADNNQFEFRLISDYSVLR